MYIADMCQCGFIILVIIHFYLNILNIANCMITDDLLRVENVINESRRIDDILKQESSRHDGIDNYKFAEGIVSVDCLRCLCYAESGCRPVGCRMTYGRINCGYFQLSAPFWRDCGKLGQDFRSCSSDIMCASKCIQRYMEKFAREHGCILKCEGFSREIAGGPNGCNNPRTLSFWYAVQKQPGCKGVE